MSAFSQFCFAFAVIPGCAAFFAWKTPVQAEVRWLRMVVICAGGIAALAFVATGLWFPVRT